MEHLKILNTAQSKLHTAVANVEADIADKIAFEFAVCYQPSDGWTLLELGTARVAPLSVCLSIMRTQKLTPELFHRVCI